MAITAGINLRQSKFNLRICGDVLKFSDNIRCVRIEFAEVAVHHFDAAVNLLIADVLGTVVVDDVEHHGNDDQFIAVDVLEGLGLLFQTLIGFLRRFTCSRVSIEERLFHHPLSAVANLGSRRSILSGNRRGDKQEGKRRRQGQPMGSIQHGFKSWVRKIPLFKGESRIGWGR